jgi:hypothetical protein
MARIFQPTTEEEAAWKKKVASGPAIVRAVGERLDPWSLYRMKSTGDRVTLRGISVDGTVHVDVTGDYTMSSSSAPFLALIRMISSRARSHLRTSPSAVS